MLNYLYSKFFLMPKIIKIEYALTQKYYFDSIKEHFSDEIKFKNFETDLLLEKEEVSLLSNEDREMISELKQIFNKLPLSLKKYKLLNISYYYFNHKKTNIYPEKLNYSSVIYNYFLINYLKKILDEEKSHKKINVIINKVKLLKKPTSNEIIDKLISYYLLDKRLLADTNILVKTPIRKKI